jgi:hypothetical protein
VTGENADEPLDVMPCGRARIPRRQARRGPGGSGLEGVGPGPHGWRGGARAAHGVGQDGRAPGAPATL